MHAKGRCVVVALALAMSSTAWAQQQPTVADRETARNLMDEADKKRDAGDLKGALKSYEAADAIMKVPTTGIEVARGLAALGQLVEAREAVGRVLRIPLKPGEPGAFAAARKAADAMNADLAARIPSVQIVLLNAEREAGKAVQITVDEESISLLAAGVPRKVNPGTHGVVVKVGSYDKKQDVTVVERDAKTVTFDLADRPSEPAKAAKPPNPSVDEDQTSANPTPKIMMFGGFGIAALGIGVGTVTGLMSISQTNELQSKCPNNDCPPGSKAEIDSATGLGNVATVAFVAGGVGLGVGIVGLILSPSSKTSVRAVLGPSYAGLTGAF